MVDMNVTEINEPLAGKNLVKEIECKNDDNSIADQEEGQIIDDVEFETISSDEDPIVFTEADEASMRKRIEELELRNAELEKIANISVINNYDLGSNKVVSQTDNQTVDIIELSDYDEYSSAFVPYETKYNGLNNYYNKFPKSSSFSSVQKDHHKSRKRHRREHSSENRDYEEKKSSKISKIKKRRKKSHSPILQFSNIKEKSSNSKRRQGRSKHSKKKRRINKSYVDTISSASDELEHENFELNREELRKAIKRNSETARKGNLQNIVSKTKSRSLNNLNQDIIDTENNNEVEHTISDSKTQNENVLASDDSDSLEEQTLRLIALKSAIVKKHLDRKKRKEIEEKKPYSPSDFDYWCNGISIENSPKYLDDIENVESNHLSPSESPINLTDREDNTDHVAMSLVNSENESDTPIFIDGPKTWKHELPSIDVLKQFAPPAPKITILSPIPLRFDKKFIKEAQVVNKHEKTKNTSPDEVSDEEELALRALLLSKLNSPKVNNVNNKTNIPVENADNKNIENVNSNIFGKENANDSVNIDDKGNLLRGKNLNKTQSLLKEAVKRLQTTNINDFFDKNDIFEESIENSSNELEKSNEIVPDITNTLNDVHKSLDNQVNMESTLYLNCKSKELLINSRKKLKQFMQYVNKEEITESEVENNQNSDEISDFEDSDYITETNNSNIQEYANENQPESCITTLQKIIEQSYEKLVLSVSEPHMPTKVDKPMDEGEKVLLDNRNEDIFENENENVNIINSHKKEEYLNATEVINKGDLSSIYKTKNSIDNEKMLDNATVKNLKIINTNFAIVLDANIQSKIDTSLEITKKIESLQKLSESIAQTTKITAKANASLEVNKTNRINSNSQILKTIVQNRKIVKMNKVINQTSTSSSNRTHSSNQDLLNNKIVQLSSGTTSRTSPAIDATSTNHVSKVNRTSGKLIINVGATSSSEDEDMWDHLDEKNNKNQDLNYDDIHSPMSFQLDSPRFSPNTSLLNSKDSNVGEFGILLRFDDNAKTKIECENKDDIKDLEEKNIVPLCKSVKNEVFEAKLEMFLKKARTQVEIEKNVENKNRSLEVVTTSTLPLIPKTDSSNTTGATPMAVRNLPESSQLEYRMLVNRMKILERQKIMKQQLMSRKTALDKLPNVKINSENIDTKTENILESKDSGTSNNCDNFQSEKNENTLNPIKDSITTQISSHHLDKESENSTKEHRIKQSLELLKKYEVAYEKNSNLIIENLNRALKFVSMGKEVKTKKVLLEAKLEKLKAELKLCETDLKLENQKISKIYPAISKSYETIVNLKGRRNKLNKVSKHLGKMLNGNSYRLKEVNNTQIQYKFKHLSNEINYLKNLKICDIEKKTELDKNNVLKLNDSCSLDSCYNDIKSPLKDEQMQLVTDKEMNKEFSTEDRKKLTTYNESEIGNENRNDDNIEEVSQNLDLLNVNKEIADNEDKLKKNNNIKEDQTSPILDQTCDNLGSECGLKSSIGNNMYISPLDFLKENENSNGVKLIDPNVAICPFELMGQCDDKDCKYNHIN